MSYTATPFKFSQIYDESLVLDSEIIAGVLKKNNTAELHLTYLLEEKSIAKWIWTNLKLSKEMITDKKVFDDDLALTQYIDSKSVQFNKASLNSLIEKIIRELELHCQKQRDGKKKDALVKVCAVINKLNNTTIESFFNSYCELLRFYEELPIEILELAISDKLLGPFNRKKRSTTATLIKNTLYFMEQFFKSIDSVMLASRTLISPLYILYRLMKEMEILETKLFCKTQEDRYLKHFTTVSETYGPIIKKRYACMDGKLLTIKNTEKKDTLTIAAIGCQGVEGDARLRQIKLHLLGQHSSFGIIKKTLKALNPDILCLLGDNYYDDGVPEKAEQILDIYKEWIGTNTRIFPILGNHCYATWGMGYKGAGEEVELDTSAGYDKKIDGFSRALLQVFATYKAGKEQILSPSSNLFWNMPYRYYALDLQETYNTVIIFIDSNTIMFDQVQQKWFIQLVKSYGQKDVRIIVNSHHPLVYIGKRAYSKCEWHEYLEYMHTWGADFALAKPVLCVGEKTEDILPYNKGKKHDLNNIGKFLTKLIFRNDIARYIKYWFCAHEHLMAALDINFTNNHLVQQFTAGGGGAELQDPKAIMINQDGKHVFDITTINNDITSVKIKGYGKTHGFYHYTLSKEKKTVKSTLDVKHYSVGKES